MPAWQRNLAQLQICPPTDSARFGLHEQWLLPVSPAPLAHGPSTQGLQASKPLCVFVAGATGYIGHHVARELVSRGHEVVCLVRECSGVAGAVDLETTRQRLSGCEVRVGDITDWNSLDQEGFKGKTFDAVVSCLASRSGGISDSLAIDYRANRLLLDAALAGGVGQFVLLSAICVQKPQLAFQRAKQRIEQELMASGLCYSIVRPTAFFKSLAGQVESVKRGKPFTIFAGTQATCKPIGEADLAKFMANCLQDPALQNAVLSIGGPGDAVTLEDCGRMLFELLGRKPVFRRVPVFMFSLIIPILSALGFVLPRFRDMAEFARIGRYYATESMLLLDPTTGMYDAAATPSFGRQTLRDFYERVLEYGLEGQELGDHALFDASVKIQDR